ncbi:MAG: nucleoside-diphosphate-sugar pyrophosphorylase [Paucimonas sp.]|jgi:NDP-sugar pyrophosphorylase family protein|nr:nucleoside-diphosphate-sugar pyrophosphorylase [Paucimonas sp.]
MRAIILAGGKGTRLRPYTTLIPKPLVPLGGKYSILEIILMQLKRNGFTHVTLAVNHLSNLIMAYFGDGSRLGLKLDYSLEEGELSTIGPLTLIDDLPENFLVMNGDILCDLDYRAFFSRHIETDSQISVSAFRRQVKIDFGVLRYDESGRLTAFQEKPVYDFDVSMGIYCINRAVIEALPRGKTYGFDSLMMDGLARGQRIDIRPFSGYWLDIGRPDDYQHADENFDELSAKLGIE